MNRSAVACMRTLRLLRSAKAFEVEARVGVAGRRGTSSVTLVRFQRAGMPSARERRGVADARPLRMRARRDAQNRRKKPA